MGYRVVMEYVMDYVTETIDSETLTGIVDLPLFLRHIQVEITVKPASTQNVHNAAPSAYGIFHNYADPTKIAGEQGAWERAAVEKRATYC